ncbi:glycosyltransferase family 2 protein [Candidatus Bathyarchaeota archaeon]|nr:glycosyltransferase family 2 protein [Candidatus Bathyarchaeota archaeon]
MKKPKVTVLIPAFNEEESLPILVDRLRKLIKEGAIDGDILIVDDGSTDRTGKVAEKLAHRDRSVGVIRHRRNLGKSQALRTGIPRCTGDYIVVIDADLQYAPEDIPRLISALEGGLDVVNGWRRNRRDSWVRKFPSGIYNMVSQLVFDLKVNDYNSGLKAFRREVLEGISLRSDLHRYMLPLAHQAGFEVGEIEISHFPRKYGRTKYGSPIRFILGVFDLISLRLQFAFLERPMTLFGLTGILLSFLGALLGLYVISLKIFYREPFGHHMALVQLSALLVLTGLQSFFFGFLADILATTRIELLSAVEERRETKRRR